MSGKRRTPRRYIARIQRRRLVVLAGLGLVGYAALVARAVQLQALDAEWLAERAARQHESRVRLGPLRGEIRDRRGILLAGSAQVESVAVSPRRIEEPRRAATQLAGALGRPRSEIEPRLRANRSFAWIQRWVSAEQAERVRRLGLEGVHLHPERRRFYPSRKLAAAFLGFAGRDGEGLSGIELVYDEELRGSQREFPARRDGRGRRLLDVAGGGRRTGGTLVLALDSRLQHHVEAALERALERTGARRASLVALDPTSGDVLAVAQAPGFDPNRFWEAQPSAFRTRALVDAFEPGSTLKPFTVAVALERGAVTPDDLFDCERGSWRVLDRRIRDSKPYAVLSVRDIVRVSSNIGAAKIANRVGSRVLVAGLRRFGFGSRPQSGFPGEAAGRVHELREAQAVERANLAFGQGITVSALQLATAAAVLANGGRRVQPRLALRIELGGERVEFPGGLRERVLSRDTARTVLAMMREVVESGTGRSAALQGYAVAGKTGTAQKVVDGRYSEERFVASFLGFVPAGSPRLVVVIVIDEPRRGQHTGGAAAAPVFREVGGFAVELLGLAPKDPA